MAKVANISGTGRMGIFAALGLHPPPKVYPAARPRGHPDAGARPVEPGAGGPMAGTFVQTPTFCGC
jgi:hypothetical protein